MMAMRLADRFREIAEQSEPTRQSNFEKDLVAEGVTTEEMQTVDFLSERVRQCDDWWALRACRA